MSTFDPNKLPEATPSTKGAMSAADKARFDTISIAGGCSGVPIASQMFLGIVLDQAMTLPAGLSGSYCKSLVAATSSYTLSIRKNGSSIGSINFAASATTGTFTFASSVSFVPGDILTVLGAVSPDSTLANVMVTLVGSA